MSRRPSRPRQSPATQADAMLHGRFLHVDDDCVVVDKPAGIATSGRTLDDRACLQGRLIRSFGGMIWAVHQLDKATTGVNVFSRTGRGVDRIRTRMTGEGSRKVYLALVHGDPGFERRLIDAPIGYVDEAKHLLGITGKKAARTEVEVLLRARGFAMISARLLTGRTHQVRIHLAHVGHPLVGEPFYGPERCELAARQCLHASLLRLAGDEFPRRFVAPVPADFREAAARVGLGSLDEVVAGMERDD